MTALLARDLRLLAPYAWLIAGGHLLFAANGTLGPEVLFWINVVLALTYTVGLAVIDWRFEADRFVAALPVDRGGIVGARYIGAAAAAAVGTGLWVGYATIFSRILPDHLGWADSAAMWTSPGGVTVFFVLAIGLALLFLPFVFGLGLGRGIWGFLIATPALAAIVARVVAGEVTPGTRLPSQGLREALDSGITAAGPALGWPALFGGLAVVAWLSLQLSIHGYRRRDL